MTREKTAPSQALDKGESDAEREAYREGRKSALRRLDAKLDELKRKSLDMTKGTREDLDHAMRAVGDKRRRFVAKLGNLRDASGDAWGDLKKGVDNSWDELEDAFGDLRKGVGAAVGRFKETSS